MPGLWRKIQISSLLLTAVLPVGAQFGSGPLLTMTNPDSVIKSSSPKAKRNPNFDSSNIQEKLGIKEVATSDSALTRKVDLETIFYKNPFQDNKFPMIKLEASLMEPIEIGLEEAIAKAIENNINLNIAREDSIVAKWDFWKQFSEMLPDFSYNLQGTEFDGSFFFSPEAQQPIDTTQVRSNFRIDYRAFSGGTKSFLTWAQKHYRKAIQLNEEQQLNQTIFDTVVFFNELMKQQASLASRMSVLAEAKIDYDSAKKFLDAGLGTKYDLFQAEARYARAEQQLIEQQAGFREAEILFAEHLNIPLTAPLKVDELKFKKINLVDDSITIDNFIETAEENNPRIKSALANKKGAYREALSKVGEFLPKLDLFADFGGTGQRVSNLVGLDTLGFLMTIDLGKGSGLSPTAEVLRARASAKRAKLAYEKEKIAIEKDLRLAFLNFEKAKSLIGASQEELKAAREGLRLARLRYKNGVGVMNEVITRQKELSEAEISLITSLAEYNNSQAEMAFQMGTINVDSLNTNM